MRYDNVTFCISLARCRTAWLCQFLAPVALTFHDPLKDCASIEELGFKIDRHLCTAPHRPIFLADTSAALFYEQISARFLNARFLFVHRPFAEVKKSMREAGMPTDHPLLDFADQSWHRAFNTVQARNDFMLHVKYDEINANLRNIWRFVGSEMLLGDLYAEKMSTTIIQVPFAEQQQKVNQAKTRRLLSSIKF